MDEQPFLNDTLSGAISDGEELDRLDSLDRLSA
jgi:hypothetical protein